VTTADVDQKCHQTAIPAGNLRRIKGNFLHLGFGFKLLLSFDVLVNLLIFHIDSGSACKYRGATECFFTFQTDIRKSTSLSCSTFNLLVSFRIC
jgi:hypothetical protein